MFEIDVSLKCNLKKSETNRGENTDIKHNCPEKGIKSVGNSLSDLRLGRNQHAGQRYSSSQRFDSVWPDDGQCDLTMARARGWKDGWFVDPSTTPHDHTWSLLLTHAAQAQTKLENDACRPPLYSQNKRTKPAPNLNPFYRRVSHTHMVTLAHTYILTCTPHMCARTDYHSVYTQPCKLRVHIRKYTHQHMQTLCTYIYVWTQTNANSVCIHVSTYTPTQTLCTYAQIYTYQNVNAVYIYMYTDTHTWKPCVYVRKYVNTNMNSVRIYGITYIPTCELCVWWCERCLLITESPKTPGHYRYLVWVLVYIPYMGLAVFSLRFLVFLCILRFRNFKVRVLNASE